MATTIHEPPKIDSHPPSHDGGWRDMPPSTGSLRSVDDSSPASRTGVWVGLAAITMTFVAFTSAMIVRQGRPSTGSTSRCPPCFIWTLQSCWPAALLWNSRANESRLSCMARPDNGARHRLAVVDAGARIAVRRRPISGLAAIAGGGHVPGHESQQLIFLLVHRVARAARAREDWQA